MEKFNHQISEKFAHPPWYLQYMYTFIRTQPIDISNNTVVNTDIVGIIRAAKFPSSCCRLSRVFIFKRCSEFQSVYFFISPPASFRGNRSRVCGFLWENGTPVMRLFRSVAIIRGQVESFAESPAPEFQFHMCFR